MPPPPLLSTSIRHIAGYISLSLLLLVLCGAWGKKKSPDLYSWHDRAQAFETLRTFDWQPADRLMSSKDSAVDRWIVGSAEAALSEHRLRRDKVGEIDFVIAYEYTPPTRRRGGSQPAVSGCRRGRCNKAKAQGRGVELDNTLYFEFQHPTTRLPIWRGRVRPVLGVGDGIEEDFQIAVRRIFEQYPPSN